MHVPVTPNIQGLERFPGVQFHSSHWNHSVDLHGKRVAVIGTGASAIQFVPPIQPLVEKLTLFQRTPPWVLPKTDLVIPKSWQNLFHRYPLAQRLLRKVLYLQFEVLNASLRYPALVKRLQGIGIRNIHRAIKDPGLRARLTPDFSLGCKRILQSNTWYRALAKPNVEVVGGIREIQGNEIISQEGHRCEIDVLIFATGFEVAVPPIAQRIFGQSGTSLHARWDGSPQAYLGTMMEDCPNLFLTLGPNLYTFASAFTMIEAQVKFIVSAISTARRKNLTMIAVNPVNNQTYNQAVQQSLQRSVWNSGCSSYFLDHHGRNSTNWPWTTFHLRARLARFRAKEFLTR
jgi:cation diffusion facilitator CzcD-associated flavoprotein CzcO